MKKKGNTAGAVSVRMLLSADISAHMCFLTTLFRGGSPGPAGERRRLRSNVRRLDGTENKLFKTLHGCGELMSRDGDDTHVVDVNDDIRDQNDRENDGDKHGHQRPLCQGHTKESEERPIFLGLSRPPSTFSAIQNRLKDLKTQWTELAEDIMTLPSIKRKLFRIQTAVLEAEEGGHPLRCKRMQRVADRVRERMVEIMNRMLELATTTKTFRAKVQGIAARANFAHQTYTRICADLSTWLESELLSRLARLDLACSRMRTTGGAARDLSQDALWARQAYYVGQQEIKIMFHLADIPQWRLRTILHMHQKRLEGSSSPVILPASLPPQQQQEQQQKQQQHDARERQGEEQYDHCFSPGHSQAFAHSTATDVRSWLRLHATQLHTIFDHYCALGKEYGKHPTRRGGDRKDIAGKGGLNNNIIDINNDSFEHNSNHSTVMSLGEFWCFVIDFDFLREGSEGGMPVTASFIEQLFVDVKEGSGDEGIGSRDSLDESINEYLYGHSSGQDSGVCDGDKRRAGRDHRSRRAKSGQEQRRREDSGKKVGLRPFQFAECLLRILSQRYQHLPLYEGLRKILFPVNHPASSSSSSFSLPSGLKRTLRAHMTTASVHKICCRHHRWLFRVFQRFAASEIRDETSNTPARKWQQDRGNFKLPLNAAGEEDVPIFPINQEEPRTGRADREVQQGGGSQQWTVISTIQGRGSPIPGPKASPRCLMTLPNFLRFVKSAGLHQCHTDVRRRFLTSKTVVDVFHNAMHADTSSGRLVSVSQRKSHIDVHGLVFSAWVEALVALCLHLQPCPYEELHRKWQRFLIDDIAKALHVNINVR